MAIEESRRMGTLPASMKTFFPTHKENLRGVWHDRQNEGLG